jgi:hypothetical protein
MNIDPLKSILILLDSIANGLNIVASFLLPGDVDLPFWAWAIIISAFVLLILCIRTLINKYRS